ncbi:hypothetical protein GTP44_26460 [Duganella sp. FT50W]|uniref:Uncharacterized protein n=1 Tax=Duganella lactea TaxID=2692173 RepID=A0A6L8MTY4_9BURK|nr:hypothetical protein [Duganella lactea]MYM85459.1 hypothetical protein [Duganella lactea]
MLSRIILLICAMLCGGFLTLSGASFSYALEDDGYSRGTSVFWLVVGALFSAPFWIPALIPSRYPLALQIGRWVGAALLLFPTLLFGSIVWHNISRSISDLGATPSVLILGIVLTTACFTCIVNRHESARHPRAVQNAFAQTLLAKACH